MTTNHKLNSKDELTKSIKDSGIKTWNKLIEFVKKLPYERHTNPTDFGLVISEKKGSCSSKHALLKKVAELNNIDNIKLILGIYRMNRFNTPKIGNALSDSALDDMPEAHCYLKIDGKSRDFTSSQSNFKKTENDLITEVEIVPEQVVEFKVDYHKQYLKHWISKHHMNQSFSEIWEISEKCIANLSNS